MTHENTASTATNRAPVTRKNIIGVILLKVALVLGVGAFVFNFVTSFTALEAFRAVGDTTGFASLLISWPIVGATVIIYLAGFIMYGGIDKKAWWKGNIGVVAALVSIPFWFYFWVIVGTFLGWI